MPANENRIRPTKKKLPGGRRSTKIVHKRRDETEESNPAIPFRRTCCILQPHLRLCQLIFVCPLGNALSPFFALPSNGDLTLGKQAIPLVLSLSPCSASGPR